MSRYGGDVTTRSTFFRYDRRRDEALRASPSSTRPLSSGLGDSYRYRARLRKTEKTPRLGGRQWWRLHHRIEYAGFVLIVRGIRLLRHNSVRWLSPCRQPSAKAAMK